MKALFAAALIGIVALGGFVAVQTGLVPLGALDGASVEASIRGSLGQTFDEQVRVECPDSIPRQKNRITDCTAILPSGRSGAVYVEQIDRDGHFRFQLDPAVAQAEFAEKIQRDTDEAVAALPRQTFVQTCQGAGHDESTCRCVYDALEQPDRDDALLGFLAGQPNVATAAIRTCGG